MAEPDTGPGTQVRIQLSTRHADIELPADPGPILVETKLRRYALSTLVNHLLTTEKPIPFEFLINGQFLRTSIDDFLTANGISAETTLNVEYVRALVPPLHVASFEHDDWVGAVDVLSASSKMPNAVQQGQEKILSASYDGLLRVWSTATGEVLATSTPPNNAGAVSILLAGKWLSPSKVIGAGYDRCVRIWNYSEDSGAEATAELKLSMELYGHSEPIRSLAVSTGSNQRILSASDDRTICVFSPNSKEAPTAPANLLPNSSAQSNKRLKTQQASSGVKQRGPLLQLSEHTNSVHDVIFDPSDSTVAYSASQDHTVKTWDLPTGTCVDTRTTNHPLLCLASMQSVGLIAAGNTERFVTLIDPRASASKISTLTLRGHTNMVSSVAVDPHSTYGLVSSSHDGTCRIWDIRSVKNSTSGGQQGQVGESVYIIQRESEKGQVKRPGENLKVFDVQWNRDVGIVAGGEDKKIQINKGSGGVQTLGGK